MKTPQTFADVLRDNETLLWYGQPRTDFLIVPYDWFLLAAVVGGTGVFSFISSIATSSPFPGWGDAAFLVAVMAIVLLRFPLDMMKRRNTHYLVTDERVVIKTDTLLDRTIRSVEYDSNFQMTPIDAPKGSTTLYFGSMIPLWDFFYPPNYPLMDMFQPPAFIFLDNAFEVMDVIIEAKRKS